jgi:L-amino acid N-acyltransferase YncA
MSLLIRAAADADRDAVWQIMEPIIRAGETYALPRDMTKSDALPHWFAADRMVSVAEDAGNILGTCYLRANRSGGGSHVANAGFMVSSEASGRGLGQVLCAHALASAKTEGFRSMQFNFVVASNERAVSLWQRMGFQIVGRVPGAFLHPILGPTDALVMFRDL